MALKTTILFFIATFLSLTSIASSSKISAVFAFGDGAADTGNNNDLLTTYRSNFRPYGRDFPNQEPTGRFSNGKLELDLAPGYIGLKSLLPPYLNQSPATDQELLTGVSFASAGSGIDPLTATLAPNALSLHDQIILFHQAQFRLRRVFGEEKTKSVVETAAFVIYSGANDFFNFYNRGVRSTEFNILGYQNFVLKNLEDVIQRLYDLGTRKVVVRNLQPIGCFPLQITRAGGTDSNRRCIQKQNEDSVVFNLKLLALISKLVVKLPYSKIIYFDAFTPLLAAIKNPALFGFEEVLKGCCGTGLYEFGPTCREPIGTCPNPSKYLFWDALNLSLAAYRIGSRYLATVLLLL